MSRLDKTGLTYLWDKIAERIAGTVTTHTMLASGWSNDVYSFESLYPSATYDIEIEPNGASCTEEQMKAWGKAIIAGHPTANQAKAYGTVPTVNIPIIIKAVKK